MSTLFRRIRSPREHSHREREEHQPPNRSFSTGQLPGHRRHKSDDIKNINYTDPNGVSNSHGQDENPPLPPRNMLPRPASVGHAHQLKKQVSSDEDPYYVAPADTIGRKAGLSVLPGPPPTASERKVMEMHERTQSQKVGHRRTGSYGHVIDNSEYSTPWNLLQQQREKEQKENATPSSTKVPPKPPRTRDRTPPNRPMIHSQPSDGSDDLIPIQSPPPPPLVLDRSLTNSPCSPTGDPSGDYDEPWDKKYPDLRMAVRRQHSGKLKPEGGEVAERSASVSIKYSPKMSEEFPHDSSHQLPPPAQHRHSSHHEPHPPPHRNSRGSPQPEPRQRENSRASDRISPPLILSSGSGGGLKSAGIRSQSERLRQPSPQPDVRPRVSSRVASEKGPREHYLSGGLDRTSPPLLTEAQLWGGNHLRDRQWHHQHSQLVSEYLPPSCSPEGTPRSGSFSVPISVRRLPSPPPDSGEPRLENRRWTRTSSPPTVHIDLSLTLENQQ